jgi:hypothetical protein
MFSIFVPDLMHGFELGSWRALFIHILRILDSVDKKLLTEVDRRWVPSPSAAHANLMKVMRRYREILAFGKDSIRQFPESISEMKRLTAGDLENLLQVWQYLLIQNVSDCIAVRNSSV